jgi:hypothetical protein
MQRISNGWKLQEEIKDLIQMELTIQSGERNACKTKE